MSTNNRNYITVFVNGEKQLPTEPLRIPVDQTALFNYSPEQKTLYLYTNEHQTCSKWEKIRYLQSHSPISTNTTKQFSLSSFIMLVHPNINEEPKYFTVRRHKNLKVLGGHLALPGGFVSEGEHPFEAAIRNLGKKTGIYLPKNQSYLTPYLVESFANGESVNLMIIYVVNIHQEIQANLTLQSVKNETDSVQWWTSKDLLRELCSPKDEKTFPPGMKAALCSRLSDLSVHSDFTPSNKSTTSNKKRKIHPDQEKLEQLIAKYPTDEKWRQVIMFEDETFDTHFWLIPQSGWEESDQKFFDKLTKKGVFFLTDKGDWEKFTNLIKDWEDFGDFDFYNVSGKLQVNIVCQYFGSWSG
jgi:ADP-ribose pyrophosphatase YjhB (NUDIX family)